MKTEEQKERRREYMRAWSKAHPRRVTPEAKAAKSDYDRARHADPVIGDRARRVAKERYATDRESAIVSAKEWADANPERRAEISKRWKTNNPDKARELVLRKYGMTLGDQHEMLMAQGGVCAICQREDGGWLCVDHCHATGRVRALLCTRCNSGLGMFGDDPARLAAAAAYLKTHAGRGPA